MPDRASPDDTGKSNCRDNSTGRDPSLRGPRDIERFAIEGSMREPFGSERGQHDRLCFVCPIVETRVAFHGKDGESQ